MCGLPEVLVLLTSNSEPRSRGVLPFLEKKKKEKKASVPFTSTFYIYT